MPRLLYDFVPATVGVSGKLWWLRPIADSAGAALSEFKEMPFPSGTQAVARRPSWAPHSILGRSRMYGVGAWTANILIDEYFRLLRQGIPAPNVVPALTAVAGPGVTGAAVPYLRFLDSRSGRVGPLSAAGASVALTNQKRQWGTFGGGNLPTSSLDSSVDMLQGLVSMDGALARVAWTRQLGVTSVTEAVATLALGEAAPATNFTELPYGIYNVVYHDRQAVLGNDREPGSLFLSALGYLERYEGLKFTTQGEPFTGAFPDGEGDTLFAGSRDRIYKLTGFTEGDFVWQVERPDMGLINHHGVAFADKKVIVPTTVGMYLYAGGWTPIMGDRQTEWAREYKLWRDDYEAAFGFYDPERLVYTFGPVRHSKLRNLTGGDAWVEWVLNCEDLSPGQGGGFRGDWANDVQARKKTSKAVFFLPGSAQPEIVSGNEDGFLRLENQDDDDDDDGDAYLKRMIVEPASLMPDVGGSPMDGFTFQKLWSYMQSELSSWIAEIRAGSRKARLRLNPDFSDTTAASAAGTAEAQERELHVLEQCGGDALNYGVVIDRAKGVAFNGFGGTHSPGLGSTFRRGADARGLGPGQVVDLTPDPDGGASDGGAVEPVYDNCGIPETVVAPDLTSGTWFHFDDPVDTNGRSLVGDRTLSYIYAVQYRDDGGDSFTVRVKRFPRQVAGEANIVFCENTGAPNYYFIGLTTGTVVTRARTYFTDNANGEIVSGFTVSTLGLGGHSLQVDAYWADSGVVRMVLTIWTTRALYKFVGTPVPVVEAVSGTGSLFPINLFTQGAVTLLHTRNGSDKSYDFPDLTENHPFPTFTDYVLDRWGQFLQPWMFPQVAFGGSFYFPIKGAGGLQNVGFIEFDAALAYTKRFFTTAGLYPAVSAAWLSGGLGYLLATALGGVDPPHILRFSGGAAWTDLGVGTPFTAAKTIASATLFSGISVYGLYFDNGGTNNVFLYKADAPFTAWSQVGSFSHAQASMSMIFMSWVL
jgi:hypothetical protein